MTLVDDLRYPIGPFKPSPASTADDRAANIAVLAELPERLSEAVDGLDDAQLDTPYREGGWTVRQVVHHVADSHMNSYIRFKLALTEYEPIIKPYDEAAWAVLPDSRMPVDVSLTLTWSLHERWVELLESMTEEDFQKKFVHPERGVQDLATTLALYAWHSLHHTAHITTLRARMGW
ncbi:MAG TPA: bacillithiol transferase BstA [Bryobacteraceae bacterium]|nr:bacillithiol transferase BstA [Bryobacteraceae bacterium]